MLLTEYDEKKHMRDTYKEGYDFGKQDGYQEGQRELLEELVQKKLRRGKQPTAIAEELEAELAVIQEIIRRIS